jgi:hypothetical protein
VNFLLAALVFCGLFGDAGFPLQYCNGDGRLLLGHARVCVSLIHQYTCSHSVTNVNYIHNQKQTLDHRNDTWNQKPRNTERSYTLIQTPHNLYKELCSRKEIRPQNPSRLFQPLIIHSAQSSPPQPLSRLFNLRIRQIFESLK